MKFSIRSRLLMVALLGAVTCVLALYSLGRPFAAANRQRFERAHDGVAREVQRLRAQSDSRYPRDDLSSSGSAYGLRSGRIDDLSWTKFTQPRRAARPR